MHLCRCLHACLVVFGIHSVAFAQTETEPPPAAPAQPTPPELAPPPETKPDETQPPEQQPEPTPPVAPQTEPPPQEPPAEETPQTHPEPPTQPIEQLPEVSAPTTLEKPKSAEVDSRTESKHMTARDYDARPLALELRAGLSSRIGSTDHNFTHEELNGMVFGLGSWLAWNSSFSIGLELEHASLGRARAQAGDSSINASYSMSNLWLGTRVYPWRSEQIELFLSLRLGLGLQHLSATGTRQTGAVGAPAASFSCSEVDGPDLGFGGGFGANFRISRHVAFLLRADAVGQRASGEVLGNCAVGIGSVTTFAATGGLAYEFELTPKPRSVATHRR